MYLIFVLQHQNPYFLSSPLYPYLQRFHSRIRRPPSRGSRPRLFGLVKQYNSRGSQCLGLWQFHWWQLHCQLLLSFDPQHWGFEYHWQSQCQHLFGHVIHQGGEPRVLISPTRTQTILKEFLFIPRILYVYRTSYLSKLNPKKIQGIYNQIHHHENQRRFGLFNFQDQSDSNYLYLTLFLLPNPNLNTSILFLFCWFTFLISLSFFRCFYLRL